MKIGVLILTLALLAAGAAGPPPAARQESAEDVIRVDTDLVVLRAAVTDKQGHAVTGLGREDFKVYEDGVEQQVGFFSAEESPVSWGLVLDRSGSMEMMMEEVYGAALHVIDEGTSRDEMFIVTFNGRPEVESEFTSDKHRLENSVIGVRAEGETALYDAVAFALDRFKGGKHRKKVLVVVTDGEDNASRLKFRELVERAEEEEVVVYTVGMFDEPKLPFLWSNGGGTRTGLKKLAEVTGGAAHFPKDADACRGVMQEIAREVSRQYSIGYYPANKARDGKWRSIKVEVREGGARTKLVARTRTGYYARATANADRPG